ncbi:MAG: alpha/beta hydrolase [Bacteroidales bacterium]|nr:alpha/beta hydrolase [Bacteroidales bacterium]
MEIVLNHQIYKKSDSADWMVFVHGAGGSTNTWLRQVVFFRQHFNLLLFDLRDHGLSKFPEEESPKKYDFDLITRDIISLVDYLKIKEAHFMAVSLGSLFVRKIEEYRPDLVRSIVFAGGIFKLNWKMKFLITTGRFLSNFTPFSFLYQLYALILLPKANHKASRRVFIREAKKIHQREFMKWLQLSRELNTQLKKSFSRAMEVPSLVVMGSEDHVFLKPALRYSAKYSNTILKIIAKSGHVCNIERANEFNEEALRFLATS